MNRPHKGLNGARGASHDQTDAIGHRAVAEAVIVLPADAFAATVGDAQRGADILAAARIAGIMACKKTSDLIPLCSTGPIASAHVEFEPIADRHSMRICATVETASGTGAELEALMAANIAALTIYDMVKSIGGATAIESVRVVDQSGGKRTGYRATSANRLPTRSEPRKAVELMNEVAAPRARDADAAREAFRAFMTSQRLRATEWAKSAGIPAAQIYAYLTGKARVLAPDTAKKLARACGVRPEDMFR